MADGPHDSDGRQAAHARRLAAVDLHWLHYGPPPGAPGGKTPAPPRRDEKYAPTQETIELASKIEALSPHHRYLMQELIEHFYGDPTKRR